MSRIHPFILYLIYVYIYLDLYLCISSNTLQGLLESRVMQRVYLNTNLAKSVSHKYRLTKAFFKKIYQHQETERLGRKTCETLQ